MPVAVMASDTVQLAPGRWQESITLASVTLGGKAMPLELFKETNETKFTCMTPDEARDPAGYFMEESKKHDCDKPNGTVTGGRIAYEANCKLKGMGTTTLAVDGSYSREAYRTSVRATAKMNGQPFDMAMVAEGRFVGACKGDEQD